MTIRKQQQGIVQEAFEAWAATEEGVFDLPDENTRWMISGSAPWGQTFQGREAFLEGDFAPIADRFAKPMKPTIRGLFADGDTVIARWEGVTPMKDGQTYRNHYAGFFTMRDGKIVEATAFLGLATYGTAIAVGPLPTWPNA